MRGLLAVVLLVLLSACATSKVGGGAGDKNEVAAATAAWRTAYDSRDPARITEPTLRGRTWTHACVVRPRGIASVTRYLLSGG